MHISRNTYKGLVDNKGILKLLILEFLKQSRFPKTVMEIRNHLLEQPENNILTQDKGVDGNSVSKYLVQLEKEQLTKRTRKDNADNWTLHDSINSQEAIEVKGESLAILRGLSKMLKPYSYLPFFDDLNEWIDNNQSQLQVYEEEFNNNNNITVDFDAVRDFTGDGIISFLYDSINDQTAVTFKYVKFPFGNTKEKKVTKFTNFHPYMLKEHGKRWYLIGYYKKYENFLTLGLDRIDLEASEGEKFERIEFNPTNIWQHSMGIYTRWEDNNKHWNFHPEKVTFQVKNGERYNNIDYLVSDPLHPSQKPNKVTAEMFDNDDYVEFSLNVFIDTDLVRKLRSIGVHNLKEINPPFLDKWVRED
ncbi:MAG: WYL domain-containing protein [Flavobacteriales bacterium]|nr:WYL domain-containing protein [Flavobacteriales bacterium]